MWMYNPQKRQDGSAFALTYRLLLRSCKLMGAVVISPLPSLFTDPAESLSPSTDFPVSPVIRLPCSADFTTGRGGLLQLLSMTLSPCWSLPTPPKCLRRISPCNAPCCLRPKCVGSAFGLLLSRPYGFTCVTA